MRKIMTLGMAAALFAALAVVPGSALARKHSCPASARVDRNHDRISDRWECKHHLSLSVNQARRDQDRDGLNNRGEFQAGDDPRDADTDNDGVRDGAEHTGTIAGAVDATTGLLTINLAGGGTVTAKVVAGVTRVKCENEHGTTARASRHGASNAGPGSVNSGRGSDDGREAADDHGDGARENEPGDDRGNDNAAACSTALTAGLTVREAKIEVTSAGPVFEEIELG
ncbi:MAG: hypothetical protein M3Z33_06320 [Actinomycetota bacterium]|nr:hypothetical protein [Actinomycetota bacterium]